jgi:UDP-N-acetylglucosamine--N-acetylmuramyl-(pentapeptide) pyrophosphoryl-undecaprenol N-acetylglucosamine transferase
MYLIHQTGATDEDVVRQRYKKIGIRARVNAFFKDMAEIYRNSDLVISRAGATTLAELGVMGLPAFLIPYPYAADGHQKTNALYYQNGGAASMFEESSLSGDVLAGEINAVLEDSDRLAMMAANMQQMGTPQATDNIINECLQIMKMDTPEATVN